MYQPDQFNSLAQSARLNGHRTICDLISKLQAEMNLHNYIDGTAENVALGWREKCNPAPKVDSLDELDFTI